MTALPSPLDSDQPLAHALAYAQLGWRVAPIPPGLKHPVNDFPREASTEPEQIQQWWTTTPIGHRQWGPDFGVSIVTGAASGLFVLDVDPRHGGDETLAELEATHGSLPDTVQAITGGGGSHLYFQWPAIAEGMDLRNSAGQLGAGLDIRAEGGQVVAPPTVHPDPPHRRYQWELSSRPGEVPVAPAPGWLVDLLLEPVRTVPDGQIEGAGDQRYAWDAYNSAGNAEAVRLLTQHGWHSPRTDRSGVTYLVRPGKGRSAGAGCSVGKIGPGITYCFTSEAPPLEAERGYRLAELLAVLEHGGNRSAADAGLAERSGLARTHHGERERAELAAWIEYQHGLAAIQTDSEEEDEAAIGPQPIHWPDFWRREHAGEAWMVEPILPLGRQVALWARHKTGKSLITLEVAAAIATGKAVLSQPACEAQDVVYLDMEMTEDDVRERLEGMGYGPDDDLSRLHYYLLPSLPSLDTTAGGEVLHAIADRHQAKAVIIDTMARVVAGDENDADTYRDFYRCTGMGLKARGISVLRLDHGGKDPTKGQRGSSSKGDDVDVVWQLRPIDGGLELKRDVSRMAWVPEKVKLTRHEKPLRHATDKARAWPEGTKEAADELLAQGLGPGCGLSQNQVINRYKGDTPRAMLREAFNMLAEARLSSRGDDVAEVVASAKARGPWEG